MKVMHANGKVLHNSAYDIRKGFFFVSEDQTTQVKAYQGNSSILSYLIQ